jgi:DNA-binding GntR family transcriptional regulator
MLANRLRQRALASRLDLTVAETRPSGLTGGLYEQLRQAIVSGDLRPNQRLIEVELAQGLQVSRTPVREALQRLALDGLVLSHRRGWIVREHTATEIEEIYECRMALEGYAARLAAERATPEQVPALEEILHRGRDDLGPPKDWMVPVNDAFHNGVIEAAQNGMLADLCTRSRLYYFNSQIALLYTVEQAAESRRQHYALVEAIRERDGRKAEGLAREHVATALKVLIEKLS